MDDPDRYKNVLFAVFLLLWIGPSSLALTTFVSLFLYGSDATLPWLKQWGGQLYWELLHLVSVVSLATPTVQGGH